MNLAAARRIALLLLLALLPLPAGAAEKPQINVQEFTLPNGMRWLLFERHDSPTVVGGWVAHVGSVNEREGITGISHLFEHMMFKGTRVIGTKDIDADLRIIEEQEKVRAEMREEMKVMRERQRKGEIDDLAEAGEPDLAAIARAGQARSTSWCRSSARSRSRTTSRRSTRRTGRRGSTRARARTGPSTWCGCRPTASSCGPGWSRTASSTPSSASSTRSATSSTRSAACARSRPRSAKYDEAFNALFWEASPYKWPVVGWPSDVSSITKAQADAYFGTYYAPNNLTGVLVGDFSAAAVRPLLERYFGRIPAGRRSRRKWSPRSRRRSARSDSTRRRRPRPPCASGTTRCRSSTRTARWWTSSPTSSPAAPDASTRAWSRAGRWPTTARPPWT